MYNKEPHIQITGDHKVHKGYQEIASSIEALLQSEEKGSDSSRAVIVIECYPSVRQQEIIEGFQLHMPGITIIKSEEAVINREAFESKIANFLTDDRVLGYMAPHQISEFYDPDKLTLLQNKVASITEGLVLVIGFGSSLITQGDKLIYADITRWEVQLRYRSKEMGNWQASNENEDILRKYKRGFFFEWRMADRLKRSLFAHMDFYLDTNVKNEPKMISRAALQQGLDQVAKQPFRLVPYFDPGVWGGTWLEENIGLDVREHPYAWGFDGVPEENSLYLVYGNQRLEVPAINLVFLQPKELLGERVYARFGAEFPIRFDFLDTMGGQHLSLQVHPTKDYIRENFGMEYTQDESYYILDAKPGAQVYLGLRKEADPEQLLSELEQAQNGSHSFPAEKYVNVYPASKHDHFSIPAGTIHCSGKDCMVLEISATPYIFTFKLWDWDRLGLDGKPRPVHLQHGAQVIQWDRTTDWVDRELIGTVETIAEGEGWREERTGLHRLEFIETRRHWFSEPIMHQGNDSVHVLNLVEGEEAVVESPDGAFEAFVVHYAETFIIPASIARYRISPSGASVGKTIATIKAYVRG